MKLNSKGFTLVEVLAVIVILGILATIMIPITGKMMTQNKTDNYNNLKESILSSTRMYISDNRYNIVLDENCTSNFKSIQKINEVTISNNKITIESLITNKYLNQNIIKDPRDNNKTLNNGNSYVIVKYSCQSKEYIYQLDDSYLVWN